MENVFRDFRGNVKLLEERGEKGYSITILYERIDLKPT